MRYRITIITALVFSLNILQAIGQNRSFVYPVMPDSLKSVEQRLNYLGLHYWDNFDFKDTLQLSNANISEQGFVNFIDLIPHFTPTTAEQSVHIFASKAFGSQKSKAKFESLIEHYLGNPKSPMRNDKVYLLFIKDIIASPCIDDVEKERWTFKYKQTNKNLPGNTAIDFKWKDEKGMGHQLNEYKNQKVILYFYDPDCENCHKITAWLNKQTIPEDIQLLRIHADDKISDLYSLRAMPTIYLLDKNNKVILKDCSPELLISEINKK